MGCVNGGDGGGGGWGDAIPTSESMGEDASGSIAGIKGVVSDGYTDAEEEEEDDEEEDAVATVLVVLVVVEGEGACGSGCAGGRSETARGVGRQKWAADEEDAEDGGVVRSTG